MADCKGAMEIALRAPSLLMTRMTKPSHCRWRSDSVSSPEPSRARQGATEEVEKLRREVATIGFGFQSDEERLEAARHLRSLAVEVEAVKTGP